jgi:ankyrin repeat-rich membrane spanning protein
MLTAAFKGESDETIRLVENGAYVNAKDMYECTALHMAAYRGDKMLARRLIQAGALKDVRDLMDETPEQMAERLNNHEVAEIIRGTTRRPNTHSLGTDIGISDGPVG